MVEEAAVLCLTPPERLITETEAKRIWSLLDEFSCCLKPATIEGLRLTDSGVGEAHIPFSLKWGAIVALLLTISFQGYAIIGAQAIDGIDRRTKEQQIINSEMNRVHEAQPALLALAMSNAAPAGCECDCKCDVAPNADNAQKNADEAAKKATADKRANITVDAAFTEALKTTEAAKIPPFAIASYQNLRWRLQAIESEKNDLYQTVYQ